MGYAILHCACMKLKVQYFSDSHVFRGTISDAPKYMTKKNNTQDRSLPTGKTPNEKKAPQVVSARNRKHTAVVGIGASAGGLEALTELLQNLPTKTGLAFVYVQHLDPSHKSLLASILSRVATIPVLEARQKCRIEADHLYIIPPNKNMTIVDGVLQLAPRIGNQGRLISIDNFFRSLAADQKHRAIGVILSGNASDGVLGLEAIKGEGGITFAQDENTARHPSMPHSANMSGAADYTLTPTGIARELGRISSHPLVAPKKDESKNSSSLFGEDEKESLSKIFAILRVRTRVNFFHYKSATLKRRIARRMVLHKTETLPEYIALLHENPEEIKALFNDMLINVTDFFRDTETFLYLKKQVIPALLRTHPKDEPIRIWAAGCSTGEEAYSLAMSFVESMEKNMYGGIQIFGSDLSDVAINKARAGLYPLSIATDVSPERLRRFFTKANGQYQISKAIRDMCVFAKQDLITDPPFSQIDLITCRNVMIYLEPGAQKLILQIFHYALKPNGFLMLGKSEGIGVHTNLYLPKDKNHKIYSKKPVSGRRHLVFEGLEAHAASIPPRVYSPTRPRVKDYTESMARSPDADLSKDVDRVLLASTLVPASVVIDESFAIVQFRGDLTPYLNFPTGKATWNLLKMASEDLMMELRGAIIEAGKTKQTIRRSDVVYEQNGEHRVNIEVIPLNESEGEEKHLLIVFGSVAEALDDKKGSPAERQTRTEAKKTKAEEKTIYSNQKVEKLERDFMVAKEHVRSLLEEQDAMREEFQSVNEEIVSSNEELQSTNEELETAKEELQSTNEELVTVNEELQTRNAEQSQTNNDLSNVLNSASVPIIIVDRELRIRRFTPIAQESLRIAPSDVGRNIADLKLPIRFPDLERRIIRVIEHIQPEHEDVQDETGRWYTLWVRPYKTWDNKIDGAVITLIDINAIKKGQYQLERLLSFSQGILNTMREPHIVLNNELRVKSANDAFYNLFQVDKKKTEGEYIYQLGKKQWDTPKLREALEQLIEKKTSLQDLEVAFDFPNIGPRVMVLNAQILIERDGEEELILLAMDDITEHRMLQERNDTFVSMASHELKTPVTTVKTLVQILQKRFEASEDKMLVEYLAKMGMQIEQLTHLVSDLLDISKIKAGKFELDHGTFSLQNLAREIVENYQLLSPQHTISLRGSAKVKVKGDHERIGQVLINLIVNAIKYSPKADSIIVKLKQTKKEVILSVQDFGIGVKKGHQTRIFERYFQVKNKVGQNFSGLGMGLYISAAIIERHGGRLWVESVGNGSTFFFSLPVSAQRKASKKKRAR